MPEREVISLDVDAGKPSRIIRKADGSLWLHYFDTKGDDHELPLTLIGLGDLLGSRTTLSGLESNRVEPKDINRLITSLRPTGKVAVQDDFEAALLKWHCDADPGFTMSLATNEGLMGGQCLYFKTPLQAGKQVVPYNVYCRLPNHRIGMELWMRVYLVDYISDVGIYLHDHDGQFYYDCWVEYFPDTNEWKYKDVNNNFVAFPGKWYGWAFPYAWTYLKLVGDFNIGEYVAFYVGDRYYDMRGIKMRPIPYPGWEYVTPHVILTTKVDTGAWGWIDNFVLTCEEP